ncbi:MAG TPA: 4'-phosphopantetheinyl transferase superfamily protein [Patescibacteria group bacterium]|jgi:phosphopantetheine--protein transferase-like protein|nr:4'-phosphopantetheinyl transferase superfamily protein [Patescibacteria group bacterium]
MKQAVGIDIVQVSRFKKWAELPDQKLLRVFSAEEIAYAKKNSHFTAQRLAVRFAAKEAFLKAFQQLYPHKKLSLLTIFSATSVGKEISGNPYLIIQYEKFSIEPLHTTLSLSHTNCCAIAVIELHNKIIMQG